MVTLIFENRTNNSIHQVTCDEASVGFIVAWYAGFHSGNDWVINTMR